MEIKLSKLLEIQKVGQELLAIKWPARTGFKLLKFVHKSEESLRLFEAKKLELFKLHGKVDGDKINIAADKIEVFTKELNELLEVTEPFELEKVQLPETAEVSIALLHACSDFITE